MTVLSELRQNQAVLNTMLAAMNTHELWAWRGMTHAAQRAAIVRRNEEMLAVAASLAANNITNHAAVTAWIGAQKAGMPYQQQKCGFCFNGCEHENGCELTPFESAHYDVTWAMECGIAVLNPDLTHFMAAHGMFTAADQLAYEAGNTDKEDDAYYSQGDHYDSEREQNGLNDADQGDMAYVMTDAAGNVIHSGRDCYEMECDDILWDQAKRLNDDADVTTVISHYRGSKWTETTRLQGKQAVLDYDFGAGPEFPNGECEEDYPAYCENGQRTNILR